MLLVINAKFLQLLTASCRLLSITKLDLEGLSIHHLLKAQRVSFHSIPDLFWLRIVYRDSPSLWSIPGCAPKCTGTTGLFVHMSYFNTGENMNSATKQLKPVSCCLTQPATTELEHDLECSSHALEKTLLLVLLSDHLYGLRSLIQ